MILAAEVSLPASCLNTGELCLEMLWLVMTAELVGWCRRGAPGAPVLQRHRVSWASQNSIYIPAVSNVYSV